MKSRLNLTVSDEARRRLTVLWHAEGCASKSALVELLLNRAYAALQAQPPKRAKA